MDDEVSVGPRLLSEQPGTSTAGAPTPTQEELRQKRLAFLSKVDNTPSTSNQTETTPASEGESSIHQGNTPSVSWQYNANVEANYLEFFTHPRGFEI